MLTLVEDELARRQDLLFQHRMEQAQLAPAKYLDEFGWNFNPKILEQHISAARAQLQLPRRGEAAQHPAPFGCARRSAGPHPPPVTKERP